jgi:hypothetical protein
VQVVLSANSPLVLPPVLCDQVIGSSASAIPLQVLLSHITTLKFVKLTSVIQEHGSCRRHARGSRPAMDAAKQPLQALAHNRPFTGHCSQLPRTSSGTPAVEKAQVISCKVDEPSVS